MGQKRIGVVGSLNMDMSLIADRIPGKGETLMGRSIHYAPGGKGANQAYAAARFGADVVMFGCVGNDENGKKLIDNLSAAGVNTEYIQSVADVPTGMAVITIGEDDNTIIVIPGANACADRSYIDRVWEVLSTVDMVLIQQEIPEETVNYVIDLCYEQHIAVVLNPAPARALRPEVIEKTAYLTPNEHEAELIFGEDCPLEQILNRYPDKLIVTMGEKGAAACTGDGNIIKVPAGKVAVKDTTGAGDTFNGILTAALIEGYPLEKALQYGNAGAGLSTTKMGAQGGMPSREEVEELLSEMGMGR